MAVFANTANAKNHTAGVFNKVKNAIQRFASVYHVRILILRNRRTNKNTESPKHSPTQFLIPKISNKTQSKFRQKISSIIRTTETSTKITRSPIWWVVLVRNPHVSKNIVIVIQLINAALNYANASHVKTHLRMVKIEKRWKLWGRDLQETVKILRIKRWVMISISANISMKRATTKKRCQEAWNSSSQISQNHSNIDRSININRQLFGFIEMVDLWNIPNIMDCIVILLIDKIILNGSYNYRHNWCHRFKWYKHKI